LGDGEVYLAYKNEFCYFDGADLTGALHVSRVMVVTTATSAIYFAAAKYRMVWRSGTCLLYPGCQ